MNTTLRVVIAPPGKPAEERIIPNTLEALQAAIGGYIEAYRPEPFASRGLLLYVNEDGLRDCAPNRVIGGQLIHGPIVVVRTNGEDECDLTAGDVAFAECELNAAVGAVFS